MGFVESDRDSLTGNSLLIGDLVLTWDDEETLSLDAETPEETGAEQPEGEEPEAAGRPKGETPAVAEEQPER